MSETTTVVSSESEGKVPGTNAYNSPNVVVMTVTGDAKLESIHPWCLLSAWQRWGCLSVLFAVCASNYFDYSVISVMLDPIKREFGVSDTMLGLLSGFCFSTVYAAASLPIALWADRGNRRTIITVALGIWSLSTVLCGFAQTFLQLALARIGLGLAEPGALPPAQSLIADYFPPGKRATPIAILNQGGSALGWLGGVAFGGYLSAEYGWRTVFVLAGTAGLALALVVRTCLIEPRTKLGYGRAREATESISRVLSRLWEKRSFCLLLSGVCTYGIFSFGVSLFLPSFMIRSLGSSLSQASVGWGVAIAIANLAGALGGGMLGDRLSLRDVRWYAWLPSIACVLAIPIYGIALRASDLYSFIGVDFVAELLLATGLPSVFAATHMVCGSRRRAVAIAALLLSFTLLGSGFGPLFVGWLSDVFQSRYGIESLRMSLTVMLAWLVPAAIAFHLAARTLPQDLET